MKIVARCLVNTLSGGLALSTLLLSTPAAHALQAVPPITAPPAPEDRAAPPKPGSYGHSMLGDAFNEIPRQRAYLMRGMPNVHFPITTSSRDAQRFFDQAIGQMHGYWFLESARSFRKVIELDPACPMGYWGLAMLNPEDDDKNRDYIAKAVERKSRVSSRERLWIEATRAYVNADPKMKDRDKARETALMIAWQGIVDAYPDDVEAKAFLAHAWLNNPDSEPKHTREQTDALMNKVLAANPMHPIHHYRIHLWDMETTEKNALNSAALCGPSSPGIAHMWHMQGHTYTGLHRYADAAYSQEASARVDHAYMERDHVLPDQIHNYAHNNQWLIENLEFLGRVQDALALGRNMIELPRHPKYNTLDHGSANRGRFRLMETLACYDLWEDVLSLDGEGYIEPGITANQQIARLTLLADAAFATGDQITGHGYLAELTAIQKAHTPKPDGKMADGKKDAKDTKSAKPEENTSEFDPKGLASSIAEARAYENVNAGKTSEAVKQLDLAKNIPNARAARLRLQIGQKDKAEELAREAVKSGGNQVAPLATLVDTLAQNGKRDEALKRFGELRILAARADLDTPLLARLSKFAGDAGCASPDWRTPVPSPTDIGPRPSLDTLGPFRWSPLPAPDFTLRSATGTRVSLSDFTRQGKPVVVIFYLGNLCSRCMGQLNAFAPLAREYEKAGITLLAISTDTPENLKQTFQSPQIQTRFPFPLLSDASGRTFKAYHAYDDFEKMPLHGTYIIDGAGRMRWQDIRFEPFTDARFVLNEAQRLLAQKPAASTSGSVARR
jgi:peroxiredoxin